MAPPDSTVYDSLRQSTASGPPRLCRKNLLSLSQFLVRWGHPLDLPPLVGGGPDRWARFWCIFWGPFGSHAWPPRATSCDLVRPHSTSFDLVRPRSTSFDLIRPHSTSFDIIRHHSTSFDLIRPRATSCDLVRPRVTSFDLVRPHLASFDLIRPRATSSDLV